MAHNRYMNRGWRFILPMLALLLGTAIGMPARAYEGPIVVQAPAVDRQVQPGAVTTVAFRLLNREAEPYRLGVDAELPEGWRLVLPPGDVVLGPGEERILLLHVHVSARASSQTYEFLLTVTDRSTGLSIEHVPFRVVVLPVRGLALHLHGVPSVLRAGATYEGVLTLTNRGNVSTPVRLDAAPSAWASARFEQEAPMLAPWESRRIAVVITPDDEVAAGRRALVVRAASDLAGVDAVQASQLVELVAAPAGPVAKRAYFPIRVGLGAVGGRSGSSPQLLASGRGALWEGADHEVAFTLRAPDRRTGGLAGARDEYRLDFRSDRLSVRLGDQVYALSPLTENGRFGTGVSGSLRLGDVTVGALYGRNRFGWLDDAQYGAFAGYAIGRGTNVGVQLLGREGTLGGGTVTLRATTRVVPGTELDVEAGRSQAGDTGAGGYQIHLAGRQSRLSYEARLLHADPGFVGTSRGTDLRQVQAGLQPVDWLRIEASWHDLAQQADDGSMKQNRGYQAGVGAYRRLTGGQLHLRVQAVRRADRQERGDIVQDFGTESVRVQSGLSLRGGGISGTAELGRTDGPAAGGAFHAYSLQGQLNLAGTQLVASATHRAGAQSFGREQGETWTIHAEVTANLGERTRWGLHGTSILERGPRAVNMILGSARVAHTFGWGHDLATQAQFRGAQNGASWHRSLEYGFAYTIPIGIPVASRRTGHTVSGRVYDAESGTPMADVLLRLGDRVALTDGDGRFTFARTTEGAHSLEVDRMSMGLDRTVLRGLPVEVHVAANDVTGLEIAVVRTATVSGRVVRFDAAPRPPGAVDPLPPVEVGGLAGVVLELTDGETRLHVVTDGEGRFQASGLRPGAWRLHVLSGDLPTDHHLAQESYERTLEPGSAAHIDVDVVPRQRQLRIIKSGSLQAD